jgi:hypothetical protein
VWPSIKTKVIQTLQAACCSGNITQRERSFEFLGFDVMLDNHLNPWILEVNMSPALAHRDSQQNSVIAQMAASMVDNVVFPLTGVPVVDMKEPQKIFSGLDAETSPPNLLSALDMPHINGCSDTWEVLKVLDPTCTLPEKNEVCDARSRGTRRPQSAGRIRPNNKPMKIPDWDDVNTYAPVQTAAPSPLEICGKAVSSKTILNFDKVADIFAKMQLIQAWFRRFLNRYNYKIDCVRNPYYSLIFASSVFKTIW